ncbi:MAG: biotin transporter BioY [Candidatus Algichlamydia australiensis]|nr:biotin transporter BioY [Chlamydiales bacterium]
MEKVTTDLSENLMEALKIVLASVFIALFAQIKIPIPFSIVPFTGGAFAVLLVGGILGKERGALAVMLYLFEGAIGFPVFAGGSSGISVLIGPHVGYLLSYPLEAFLFGWALEKRSRFLFAFLAPIVNLVFGTLGLMLFMGTKMALAMGFYPFIMIDIAKALFAFTLMTRRIRANG